MIAAKIINSFFHLSATVAWIGGMIYQTFILMPTLEKVESNVSAIIMGNIVRLFRILSVVCIILIAITGIFKTIWENGFTEIVGFSTYGIALLVKHIITLAMIVLGLLAGYYFFPKLQKLSKEKENVSYLMQTRTKLMTLAKINTLLGIIILFLAVALPFASS